MKSAKFVFNFDSKEEARIIAEALEPEIKHSL
jgi:tRNA threonylcarbamoyladenosine modification (KEOPS) complex  Pcc1 subunit